MNNEYTIRFGSKVTEKNIDELVHEFYLDFKKNKTTKYIFDFSEVEWISNQELLIITGLLKYLVIKKLRFFVQFLKSESAIDIDRRKAKQFVEMWNVWKIYQVLPNVLYDRYFDLDGNTIERLSRKFGISNNSLEIYDRYGVTPFISLEKVAKYDDRRISEMLADIYKLNVATNEILKLNDCYLPFENKTLSSIITKELYENFLDHFNQSFFSADSDYAFMSLSLKVKFNERTHNKTKIQDILKDNFENESINELKNFFSQSSNSTFKNQSILQLSFLDFGEGISNTLRNQFKSETNFKNNFKLNDKNEDTKVLEYAFRPNSSQHPISKKYIERTNIPRGLFDLLSIVKRFNGLIVIRSNFGKLLFDFSTEKSFEDAISSFGNENLFFPGTLISIYFPERHHSKKIEESSIKPYFDISKYSFSNKKVRYLSVFEIQQELISIDKLSKDIYNNLFEILINKIKSDNIGTLIYLDFKGYEIDERVSKKIIFFLISDYSINISNNIIVINPPPISFLLAIRDEVKYLSEIDKKYKIHPTPFIFLEDSTNDLNIFWLGLYSEKDIKKLNNLLFDDHDLRKTDFEEPDNVIGHVNYYDQHGNLKSIINRNEILEVYRNRIISSTEKTITKLIDECEISYENSIFLCSGNYYQHKYFQLFDVLNNKNDCEYLVNTLFDAFEKKKLPIANLKFLAITSSSQKIIKQLIHVNKIKFGQTLLLNNYHSFVFEENFRSNLRNGDKIVLVCDVISTGYLTKILEEHLLEIGAELVNILVLVDAIDIDFENDLNDYKILKSKITSIYNKPIKKFRVDKIKNLLIDRTLKVVRINPYTNTPINLSLKESNFEKSVLLDNETFIKLLPEASIKTGYFNFNNLIHPYFFDLKFALEDYEISKNLLTSLFSKIGRELIENLQIILYPKDSAISYINFKTFKSEVLKNDSIQTYELERFPTNEGWKFSHIPKFLKDHSHIKKILLLDDGSCTGESIIQMIDEVSFLDIEEIIVLSIIGRTSDHKREFFSRLKTISGNKKEIKINAFFGSHWHIPTYYIEESPVVKEQEWLRELITLANTPRKIKDSAKNVREELSLKKIEESNNKYLIKNKDGSSNIKELILKKEEIGKMASYRFYKEYFDFFNEFIITYEDQLDTTDRYKKIELISAVFLHEPYLYEKVKNILPDLIEKMEVFIQTIFFGNPQKPNKPKLNKDKLYYKWLNKDLFHLFFIIFKDKKLIEILSVNKLILLINQYCDSQSDINYIFLKLLKYIPLNGKETSQKNLSGDIKYLITGTLEHNDIKRHQSQLKIFKSFISTLPSLNTDFESMLMKVKNNYDKISNDKFHNEYIFNDKQIISTQLKVLNKKNSQGINTEIEIIAIQSAWEAISLFVEDLLAFSMQFPNFFIPYKEEAYDNLERINISLRKIHASLQDDIFNSNFNDTNNISELLDKLFDKFIMDSSEYSAIFRNITTSNLDKEFKDFINSIKFEYPSIKIESNNPGSAVIAFPTVYLNSVIFKELKENLRYADISEKILFDWREDKSMIYFEMKNKTSVNVQSNGGGKGLSRLAKLNDFPCKMTHKTDSSKDIYTQIISFKKI